jgi:hypothetical protein
LLLNKLPTSTPNNNNNKATKNIRENILKDYANTKLDK